ncbi:hypothetical protein [Nostoc sp. 'Lobaria pulmonaria (5183) cyanobiont']|uniref:hypothetical protein n=1 Tax=Nostoc sp. 'Lobaria pulmonaria (5183) cyanobiont' TaxID=1618022 RepID=UPI001F16FBA0|nr:hypothetical protein [Nostoc sp. 'Lobaria pulmonaria (5183) cyanobiont']
MVQPNKPPKMLVYPSPLETLREREASYVLQTPLAKKAGNGKGAVAPQPTQFIDFWR